MWMIIIIYFFVLFLLIIFYWGYLSVMVLLMNFWKFNKGGEWIIIFDNFVENEISNNKEEKGGFKVVLKKDLFICEIWGGCI